MPSKIKSRDPYVVHSISPTMKLSFNTSKVPYLIISESGSVMPSHSVEPIMSSSSIPADIPPLSNRYCHVMKVNNVAWPSSVPSKMKSR